LRNNKYDEIFYTDNIINSPFKLSEEYFEGMTEHDSNERELNIKKVKDVFH
jgi:hypothetical protein